MTDSLTAVKEGVSRSQDAGAALDKILTSSSRSAETANMIERAMAEQSRGIKQVSEAVGNVKQMMNQIATATQAQSKGSEMILTAAEGMRDIARQVKNAMTEQGRGGKQIAEAAENVTARAGTIASRHQRAASGQPPDTRVHGADTEHSPAEYEADGRFGNSGRDARRTQLLNEARDHDGKKDAARRRAGVLEKQSPVSNGLAKQQKSDGSKGTDPAGSVIPRGASRGREEFKGSLQDGDGGRLFRVS
jgi:methyl-accepting chemotaxis protein